MTVFHSSFEEFRSHKHNLEMAVIIESKAYFPILVLFSMIYAVQTIIALYQNCYYGFNPSTGEV